MLINSGSLLYLTTIICHLIPPHTLSQQEVVTNSCQIQYWHYILAIIWKGLRKKKMQQWLASVTLCENQTLILHTKKTSTTTKCGLQFSNKSTLLVSLKCIKSFHTVYIHKCNNSSVTNSHTHTGGEWGVKITCGRGGAHSTVPRKGVAWCISKSSASSGLTGQLVGNGSN
jgi:hypothetical protein